MTAHTEQERVRMAVWTLGVPKKKVRPIVKAQQQKAENEYRGRTMKMINPNTDKSYKRPTKVAEKKIVDPAGVFRGICKIFIHFAGGEKRPASGWLLNQSIVVTSGHCAYDHSSDTEVGKGPIVQADIIVGYHNGFAQSTGAEIRHARRVAIPWDFYATESAVNDIAFFEVSEPFRTVENFLPYVQTPLHGRYVDLALLGYPMALPVLALEPGSNMYRVADKQTYQLQENPTLGVAYHLRGYGGFSGGPVLQDFGKDERRVIGVNWGTDDRDGQDIPVQYAAPIDRSGNDFNAFLNVLDIHARRVTPLQTDDVVMQLHTADSSDMDIWLYEVNATAVK